MAASESGSATLIDRGLLALVVLVALFLVGRIIWPPQPPGPPPPELIATEAWQRFVTTGHRVGPADAAVELVVFADFECPACRRFATVTWPTLHRQYPDQVAMVFQHWPLDYHPQAMPAARAAECAASQGAFEAFHDRLFAHQDSLGKKSWGAFARESGVPDSVGFHQCTSATEPMPLIDAGIAGAKEIGGAGTPTVVINGYRWGTIPTAEEVELVVRSGGKVNPRLVERFTDSMARARRVGQRDGRAAGSSSR